MMPPSLDFYMGVSCCGLIVMLYLLYQLIQVLREFLIKLLDESKDE